MSPHAATWIVAALATAGAILRRTGGPEFVFAVTGVFEPPVRAPRPRDRDGR